MNVILEKTKKSNKLHLYTKLHIKSQSKENALAQNKRSVYLVPWKG